MNKKGLLISFFGSTNLGDVLLSNYLYEYINVNNICKRISFGINPYLINESIQINVVRPSTASRTFHGVKNILISILGEWFDTFLLRIHTSISAYKRRKKLKGMFDLLEQEFKNASFVVLGGGNMLFSLSDKLHDFYDYVDIYIRLAKKYKVPFYFECIGIGPFYNEQHAIRAMELLKQANYVTFRDEQSCRLYEKYSNNRGILSADPALLLEPQIDVNHNSGVVALNFVNPSAMHLDIDECERITKDYVLLIKTINRKKRVILYSTDYADYSYLLKLQSITGNPNIEVRMMYSLDALLELYSFSEGILASRLHSQIVAYTQKKAFVSVIWQPKVDAFVKEIGNQNNAYMYNEIAFNLFEVANKVIDGIEYSLNDKQFLIERLKVNRHIIQEAIDF